MFATPRSGRSESARVDKSEGTSGSLRVAVSRTSITETTGSSGNGAGVHPPEAVKASDGGQVPLPKGPGGKLWENSLRKNPVMPPGPARSLSLSRTGLLSNSLASSASSTGSRKQLPSAANGRNSRVSLVVEDLSVRVDALELSLSQAIHQLAGACEQDRVASEVERLQLRKRCDMQDRATSAMESLAFERARDLELALENDVDRLKRDVRTSLNRFRTSTNTVLSELTAHIDSRASAAEEAAAKHGESRFLANHARLLVLEEEMRANSETVAAERVAAARVEQQVRTNAIELRAVREDLKVVSGQLQAVLQLVHRNIGNS